MTCTGSGSVTRGTSFESVWTGTERRGAASYPEPPRVRYLVIQGNGSQHCPASPMTRSVLSLPVRDPSER